MSAGQDMIEKVAKAIYADRNGSGCVPWGHQMSSHKAAYLRDAIAAVKALQEPTDAMCSFAEDNFDRNGDNIAVCWRAFISAALSTTHNPEEM